MSAFVGHVCLWHDDITLCRVCRVEGRVRMAERADKGSMVRDLAGQVEVV